jgi:ParB family transcriptional regulator, chromosome partitioning protein
MSGVLEVKYVDVDNLKPNPYQPRQGFDQEKLEALADSLRQVEMLQPIIVRPQGSKFQIIAGERRWRACRLAGIKKVPVLIKNVPEKRVLLESFIENLHREDLTSIERENATYELWKSGGFATHEALAKAVGYRPQTVTNIIEAREFRSRATGLSDAIPTSLISETQGLDDKTRVKVLKMVERGEIKRPAPQTEIRQVVKVLKGAPEPLKEAVLSEQIPLGEAAEALNLYEEVEKQAGPIKESRVKRHIRQLKKELKQSSNQQLARQELHRTILTGKKIANKEMTVKEGTVYDIGKFVCPVHKREFTLKCDGKKPSGKHWGE